MKKKKLPVDIKYYFREQDEEVVPEEEQSEEEAPVDPEAESTPEEETEMTETDPTDDMSKMYKLKMLYNRLISVQNIINDYSGEDYTSVKKELNEVLDIFNTIIIKYDSFKERIDEIIDNYTKYTKDLYSRVDKLLKKHNNENEEK